MDISKYMRWKESLDYNTKLLDKLVFEAKTINSNYQKYIKQNPYKQKKTEYAKQKQKTIDRILELTRQGVDNYDGK